MNEDSFFFYNAYKLGGHEWGLEFIKGKQRERTKWVYFMSLKMCVGIINEYMLKGEYYQYKISDSDWEDITMANKCIKSYLAILVMRKMQYKFITLEKNEVLIITHIHLGWGRRDIFIHIIGGNVGWCKI